MTFRTLNVKFNSQQSPDVLLNDVCILKGRYVKTYKYHQYSQTMFFIAGSPLIFSPFLKCMQNVVDARK